MCAPSCIASSSNIPRLPLVIRKSTCATLVLAQVLNTSINQVSAPPMPRVSRTCNALTGEADLLNLDVVTRSGPILPGNPRQVLRQCDIAGGEFGLNSL